VAIVAVLLVELPARLHAPGQQMEEGFMILLPHRVIHGATIYRDFHYFWGPGGLWLPALVQSAFGWTIAVERAVGSFYLAVWALGAWWIARRWSEVAGLAAGIIIIATVPTVDQPIYGALALEMLAVIAAARALETEGPHAARWSILAGLLAGTAVLFRPEQILGLTLALGVLTWGRRARQWWTFLGAAIPLAIFGSYAVAAGVGHAFSNIVVAGAHVPAERRLAFPPPGLAAPLLLGLVVGGAVIVTVVGVRRMLRAPHDVQGRLLTAVGLLSLCLLAEVFQRLEVGQMKADFIAIGFLPVAALDLARDTRLPRLGVATAAVVVVALAFSAATWRSLLRPYGANVQITLGLRSEGTTTVRNRGRSFVYATATAELVEQTIARVEEVSRPGQRLFVGPADLRRTPYNDNSIAVLLPELTDSMSFPDMHPRVALADMAELVADVRRADVVVLTSAYANWSEPNESRLHGSDAANQVAAALFCSRGQFGPSKVLVRCH